MWVVGFFECLSGGKGGAARRLHAERIERRVVLNSALNYLLALGIGRLSDRRWLWLSTSDQELPKIIFQFAKISEKTRLSAEYLQYSVTNPPAHNFSAVTLTRS